MKYTKILFFSGVIWLTACDGGLSVVSDQASTTDTTGLTDTTVSTELPGSSAFVPDPELEIEYLVAANDEIESNADDTGVLEIGAAFPATGARGFRVKPAARFLNQATFGATESSLEDILAGGWRLQWIRREFNKARGESYTERLSKYSNAGNRFPNGVFGENIGAEHMVNVVWDTWINAPDQLRKRITASLLEIFVISARVGTIGIGANQVAAADFLDILDEHAFGNFRDLLYDVSRSPAMGVYLSHIDNKKAEYNADGIAIRLPDENYAREILQLFSIGLYELNIDGSLKLSGGEPIETYDQNDILNLARVFTGFVRDRSQSNLRRDWYGVPMAVDESEHSTERKRFLGQTIPAGTGALESLDRTIDIIFNHPNVGPFIGKLLIQRMVTSNPSGDYIERVARAFNDNGNGVRGDMKAVIIAILRDPEGMSRNGTAETRNYRGKLREPMMRFMHIARLLAISTDQPAYPIGSVLSSSFGLSQSPLKSPSVFNFFRPGYTPPQSELSDANLVAPEFQIVTGSAINGSVNFINDFIMNHGVRFESDTSFLEDLSQTPARLVNFLDITLTDGRMNREVKAEIQSAIESVPEEQKLDRVKIALVLVSSTRSFIVAK